MKRPLRIAETGFTLLEVLVAISIFSVVAIISYSTLDTYLQQRERLTVHYSKLERLQRLFMLLERDVQFSVKRTVRDGGEILPAMMSEHGDALITMTVAQADVQSAAGISLKRVEWQFDGKQLIRAQWNILDHDGNIEPAQLLVSEEIEELDINYFLYSENRGLDSKSSLDDGEFPHGVELDLSLDSGSSYRRVFVTASGG